jgi:phosphate acetyltransferase
VSPNHPFLEELRARSRRAKRSILFPEATDQRVLEACGRLVRAELAHPTLFGSPAAIAAAADTAGLDLSGIEVRDPAAGDLRDRVTEVLVDASAGRLSTDEARARAADPLMSGAALVAMGEMDGIVAGAVRSTSEVIRAGLSAIGPAPGVRTISSAFYMGLRDFRGVGEEVLTFTDAGVVPEPTPEQLVEIARSACEARTRIVGDEPRIAFLSFSTLGSAEGPAVDRMREAARAFRKIEPTVASSGELQVDAALMPDVAARKAPQDPVAGRANVLVFPDLNAGNIAYKLVQRLARAVALGPILQGLRRPLNDLSRGATAEDVELVACITALMGEGTPRAAGTSR